MGNQVIVPTGVNQNNEDVTTTTSTSSAATTQPRRSTRILENQKGQATTRSSTRSEPRAPRAPRPIDPIQRRKKAWPYKWETWRIDSVATELAMSDSEAVERLRTTTLDEFWKSDPQQTSLYEDALVVYDERARAAQPETVTSPEAGPSVQNNNMASLEAESSNSESTISAPETETESTLSHSNVAPADLEAVLALMSMRYGGNARGYIGYGATNGSMGLRVLNSAIVAPTNACRSIMLMDEIFESSAPVTGNGVSLSPIRIRQSSDMAGHSTRRKDKQPVNYRLSTLDRSTTSSDGHGNLNSTPEKGNNIFKLPSTVSRVAKPPSRPAKSASDISRESLTPQSLSIKKNSREDLELSTTLRRSKRKTTDGSVNEDETVALNKYDSPASPKKTQASCKRRKGDQSPMLLRSKRKVIRIEEEDDDETDGYSSPDKTTSDVTPEEGSRTRTLRRRSKRKIVQDSDDEDGNPSTNKNNGFKKAQTEETTEESPVRRRTKRKLARMNEDKDADFSLPDEDLPTTKRSKKAAKRAKTTTLDETFDTSSPDNNRLTPKNTKKTVNKSKKTSTEEDEEDEDDDEITTVKKPKQATKKSSLALVHPPTNLPLKASANTPGIPNDALALNEHFKKDTPCPLGVQLPVDRARTEWEWVPYNTRKIANANFNWADEQQRKDANRFRQQRIRRRLTEHGYIHDGRKNH
ncbi:hypothetical protein QM012_005365 [Aureobasidium pullulans]|uniref:Uncharacterized protein n=1 Tax=Aureobasidium pullulans TaxID=5580 RepID=A0ABR0T5W9_AURPU